MLKATADTILPATITGSLPRPSWYTENLGARSFLDAMVTSRFREQYVDALAVYLRDQELTGLDMAISNAFNQVDADVITFEMKSSHLADIEDVGRAITGKTSRGRTSSGASSGVPRRRRSAPIRAFRCCGRGSQV